MKFSKELKSVIVDIFISRNPAVLTSIIEVQIKTKYRARKNRSKLIGFTFGNLLMRLGLYITRLQRYGSIEVISDWPEGGDRNSLLKEYYTGFEYGRSGSISYNCGPLCNLGFSPSLIFACTEYDERLQIADMVVGIVNDFVSYSLGRGYRVRSGHWTFSKLTMHYGL